jgi:hypothetical protein
MARKIDVKPIAQALVEIVVSHRADPKVNWLSEQRIQIQISEVIPATNQQTTTSRRKKLRAALTPLLAQSGWVAVENKPWVYEHS